MKSWVSDAALGLVTLVLCGLLVFQFVREWGAGTVRAGEQPLGTIVFKRMSATRRPEGGLTWERIRNNSPVYEDDTLRTGSASEASIFFEDGSGLDMFENSMLRLDFVGAQRRFEFMEGDISVSGPSGSRSPELSGLQAGGAAASGGYTVTVGGRTISMAEGSQASFSRSGDTMTVEVLQGEIAVTESDGSSRTVSEAQGLELDLKTGSGKTVAYSVFPLLPEQNARLLLERTGSANIDFSWKLEGGESAVFELSGDRDFASPAVTTPAAGGGLRLEVAPGTWFWRVRAPDGTVSPSRRFALLAEEAPRPILPESGAEMRFRAKLPAVRFSWTEMADATAYILEVSRDRQFTKPVLKNRTALTGLTINSLGEGDWYWRVSAVHPLALIEEKAEPEIRPFSIRRKAGMEAPVPTVPVADSLFIVQEAAGKGIAFSWMPDPEAVEYELAAGRTPDMKEAVLTRSVDRTWFTLAGPEAAFLGKPGTWYWAVRWKDGEGNLSPFSKPRALQGVDGSIAVRLTFPPPGYTIADSLIGGTRFAWKSRVPAKAVFQLSPDKGFSTVAWEEPSDTETLIGREWKTGVWYWRIRTLNADGSVLHDTEPRMFRIVDPLPAPTLVSPAPGGSFYLREGDPYTVSWAKVADADYYQFRLYLAQPDGAEVLKHSIGVATKTDVELPFGAYPEGAYRILLQAFTMDKDASTRIIGYLGTTDFTFERISRMELASPADGAVFEGLDARRKGIELAWEVPDPPEDAELMVTADPAGRRIALRRPGFSGKFTAQKMTAGDYWWTVKGSLYGIDISALRTNRFTVRPIPPLPAPSGASPAGGFTFGPKELRGLSALGFTWNAVAGATHYSFALYRGSNREPLVRLESLKKPSYAFADLPSLENGEYRWTVKALSLDAAGDLEQDGLAAESRFSINLPKISAPTMKKEETYYGR